MNPRKISRILFLLPAAAMLAQPASAQKVSPPPGPSPTQLAAGEQAATAEYRCAVQTKAGAVERIVVDAASPDKAREAAVRKLGSRSAEVADVTCDRAGAAAPQAEPRAPKTRAPTPPPYEPSRTGIRFEKDGSCKLSQDALAAHPDARDRCRERAGSQGGGECPADYCATLR